MEKPNNVDENIQMFKEHLNKCISCIQNYEFGDKQWYRGREWQEKRAHLLYEDIVKSINIASDYFDTNIKEKKVSKLDDYGYSEVKSRFIAVTMKVSWDALVENKFENTILYFGNILKHCKYEFFDNFRRHEEYINYQNLFGGGDLYHFNDRAILEVYLERTILCQNPALMQFHGIYSARIKEKLFRALDILAKPWSIKADGESYRQFIYNHHNKMYFGKYKGVGINKIIESDPQYILKLIINTNSIFILSNHLMLHQNFANQPSYYTAVNINLIKNRLLRNWFIENRPYEPTDEYYRAAELFGEIDGQNMKDFYKNEIDEMNEDYPTWRIENDLD